MRAAATRSVRAVLVLLVLSAACLPPGVKELNAQGDKASAERRYEQAVSFYSQSLMLAPDQPSVRQRLESARVLLRQIYVDRIYDVVDGPQRPVSDFLTAWRLSAALPSLGVEPARTQGIRLDLSARFIRAEPKLRASTEAHNYYLHLSQMSSLVPDPAVARVLAEIGQRLQDEHRALAGTAQKAGLAGLALLHSAAAATFAPRDTGLWAEVDEQRGQLLRRLAIAVSLRVQGPAGGEHLLGALRRRLPAIFSVLPDAPLQLLLRPRRAEPTQRETRDQRSAPCQVGTERQPNPECDSLKSRVEMAKSTLETEKRALEAAAGRCASEAQASSCTSAVSSAESRLSAARRDADELERRLGACPRYIDKPVYKTFFYERRTLHRQVTTAASLTVSRSGEPLSSRTVTGASAASDVYGDGLGCAGIAPDPLQIPSLAELEAAAEARMLDDSLNELLQLRRRAAEQQLAGGESRDRRLDALVRARLIDDSFAVAQSELRRHLSAAWSSDFGLVDRILR